MEKGGDFCISFAEIDNRPAPLSFVKLLLISQIYYFCITNLGAENHAANLRFVETRRFYEVVRRQDAG